MVENAAVNLLIGTIHFHHVRKLQWFPCPVQGAAGFDLLTLSPIWSRTLVSSRLSFIIYFCKVINRSDGESFLQVPTPAEA